ncbi:MAG: 6-bladed beta-propeller [Candidatus Aminicenantes bacterium]|nr:6-bladed beta-propeller [Candidatus Aminicenantes bacterium]
MKIKTMFVLVIFLLFSFIFAEAGGNQRPAWKGKVETENGVKVIKNPKSPLYPAGIFHLEEELCLGKAEGKEAYLFSKINGLDVDDDGNLYVLDYRSSQVRVFDDRGVFLRAIGRKGQGPGEMEMPVFVQLEPSGELAVFDYLRRNLITFSLDGKYLRQSRTRESFVPFRIDRQGNIVGSVSLAPPPIGGRELKKYFLTKDQPLVIAREDQDKNRQKTEMAIAKPTLACAVSPQGKIVWGRSDDYELRILDPQGAPIHFIQKKHDLLPFSERDRKFYQDEYADWIRAGGKLVFPDHFPAFMDICVDAEERIFVKTYQRIEGTADGRYFDIFDSDGKYLAKVPIRANLDHGSVWKKNKLYTIETDSAGNPVVRRYGVHWEFPR